jgi:AbrB family looped-hinge helix DNA binding protein
MRRTAKVTSKGQITLPVDLRRELEIRPGDEVLFVRDAGRVYVERVPGSILVREVFGTLGRKNMDYVDVDAERVHARRRLLDREKLGEFGTKGGAKKDE